MRKLSAATAGPPEPAFASSFAPVVARALALAAALICASAPLLSSAGAAEPLSPAAQRGFVLVHANCSRCHSVDRVTPSPLKLAPPFRDLHKRYPVEDLEEPLAEGIITGHPSMPEFRFDADQVGAIIAYLKSLER